MNVWQAVLAVVAAVYASGILIVGTILVTSIVAVDSAQVPKLDWREWVLDLWWAVWSGLVWPYPLGKANGLWPDRKT